MRHGVLGDVDVHVEVIDEIVTRVDPRGSGAGSGARARTVVVGLVGVQTNQFPRARDLAAQFKAEGFAVMIGGFHVSGAIAMSPGAHARPSASRRMDDGITLVQGEVEERWADLLRDAAAGRLRPLYDFLGERPDLRDKPLPRASRRDAAQVRPARAAGRSTPAAAARSTAPSARSSTSRGARCAAGARRRSSRRSGRTTSSRGKRAGVRHYFFTDDNFARNPEWEAIFDGLIELREQHGMAIDFMMQVDVLAPRIPRFVDKAARAGCVQVFIGMETLRDDNLDAGGKRQNKAEDYREMIAAWHRVGVVCHVGYIIGFPYDTLRAGDGGRARAARRAAGGPGLVLHADAAARLAGPPHGAPRRRADGPRLQQLRLVPPDRPPPPDERARNGIAPTGTRGPSSTRSSRCGGRCCGRTRTRTGAC